MVLDKNGKKMSKSKGNVISPVDVAQEYGIDALRMALVIGTPAGADTALSLEKINGYKKFANKIWNATRFVMEQTHDLDLSQTPQYDGEDQQSIDELNLFIKEITKEMDEFKYYLVSEKLYHYFWDTFASNILERSKTKIADNEDQTASAAIASASQSAKWTLHTHLVTLLKALHPFMPFITEEIWGILNDAILLRSSSFEGRGTNPAKLLIIESWPTSD
jgi:valyl-tRNA synthetase